MRKLRKLKVGSQIRYIEIDSLLKQVKITGAIKEGGDFLSFFVSIVFWRFSFLKFGFTSR
jgi:hypothetical protein